MPDDITVTLHDIDTRLSVVESEVGGMVANSKWVKGIAMFLVLQVIAGSMAFARLSQQVENLDLGDLRHDISTALRVVADHGTELQSIRGENARLRGAMDQIRVEINDRTKERFTEPEGNELRRRIIRLENFLIENSMSE